MEKEISFTEGQGILEWWVWAGIVVLSISLILWLAWRMQKKNLQRGVFVVHILLIIGAIFVGSCAGFMINLGMDTEIDGEHIRARLSPFQKSDVVYAWEDVQEAHVRAARPEEMFGFAAPSFPQTGVTVVNFVSDMGLELNLHNGQSVFIGTRDPEGIQKVLDQLGYGEVEAIE